MEISNTDISTFLNMVDTFYNNAWNRLVLYGALIIVIAGIVIPIILQFISQRFQKSRNIEMENKLRKELTNSIILFFSIYISQTSLNIFIKKSKYLFILFPFIFKERFDNSVNMWGEVYTLFL